MTTERHMNGADEAAIRLGYARIYDLLWSLCYGQQAPTLDEMRELLNQIDDPEIVLGTAIRRALERLYNLKSRNELVLCQSLITVLLRRMSETPTP